jgi:hypothetical protein
VTDSVEDMPFYQTRYLKSKNRNIDDHQIASAELAKERTDCMSCGRPIHVDEIKIECEWCGGSMHTICGEMHLENDSNCPSCKAPLESSRPDGKLNATSSSNNRISEQVLNAFKPTACLWCRRLVQPKEKGLSCVCCGETMHDICAEIQLQTNPKCPACKAPWKWDDISDDDDSIALWKRESSKKQITIATSTDWSSNDDSDDCWNGGDKERATYKMSQELRSFSDDESNNLIPGNLAYKQAKGRVTEKVFLQRRCSRTITFDDESSSCSDSSPSECSEEDDKMRVESNGSRGSDAGDQSPVTKRCDSSRSPFGPRKDDINARLTACKPYRYSFGTSPLLSTPDNDKGTTKYTEARSPSPLKTSKILQDMSLPSPSSLSDPGPVVDSIWQKGKYRNCKCS